MLLKRLLLFALVFAFAPALAASARAAPPVTVAECAPCHGMDGISRDVEVPHLAGQSEVYLLNQLRALKKGVRRGHKEMLYMSRHMTDEEMQALAAYYSSLPPR